MFIHIKEYLHTSERSYEIFHKSMYEFVITLIQHLECVGIHHWYMTLILIICNIINNN